VITVVGSANVDLTFRTPRLPLPGETVIGTDYFEGLGGKGANQAVAAARLGGQVAFVGKVGNDPWGESIRRELRREGIDVTYLTTARDRPTGKAAILVNDAGENSIVVSPGANHALTPAEVRAAIGPRCRVVLVQCEVPLAAVQEALECGRRVGAVTILNPAPACDLPNSLLKCADICIPNESELRELTARRVDTLDVAQQSAGILRVRGPRIVIVTLGERGVVVSDKHRAAHVPAIPVRAVDTSGAGDAFCGALAARIASADGELIEAVKWANRVAAFSVTRPGTQTSFPRLSDELPRP
jgi:ribokinase